MRNKKIVLSLVFFIAIGYLGYTAYNLVFGPYYFSLIKEQRYSVIKKLLKNIADAQEYYLSVKKKYADNFDSLVFVLKNDSILTERNIGVESDSVKYLSKQDAIKLFDIDKSKSDKAISLELEKILAERDQRFRSGEELTMYIVKDSIYENISSKISYQPDSLYLIPFSKGDTFQLATSKMRTAGGGISVSLYEVIVYNKSFLFDQNSSYYKPEEGISLGSLVEASKDIKNIIDYATE